MKLFRFWQESLFQYQNIIERLFFLQSSPSLQFLCNFNYIFEEQKNLIWFVKDKKRAERNLRKEYREEKRSRENTNRNSFCYLFLVKGREKPREREREMREGNRKRKRGKGKGEKEEEGEITLLLYPNANLIKSFEISSSIYLFRSSQSSTFFSSS